MSCFCFFFADQCHSVPEIGGPKKSLVKIDCQNLVHIFWLNFQVDNDDNASRCHMLSLKTEKYHEWTGPCQRIKINYSLEY